MRRAAKRDANEREIIEALESLGGVTVQQLDGAGVPDLLVGCDGVNLLLEVKDGDKPPSARKLTRDQVAWHSGWRGQVHTVCNVEQALEVVADVFEAIAERAAKRWAEDDFACDDNAKEETQRTHGASHA